MLSEAAKLPGGPTSRGTASKGKNREEFGLVLSAILSEMSEAQRLASVRVFDSDLEGSCGLHHVRKAHPEVFVSGGVMERGNFSAAAGFGWKPGQQVCQCIWASGGGADSKNVVASRASRFAQ